MRPKEKLRNLLGVLKDKTSIIKALLSFKRSISSVQTAVLRATTHDACGPPSEKHVAAILSLAQCSPAAAFACIAALADRLHRTHNAVVALKCLYTVHNMIAGGCLVLKDQASFYNSFDCGNHLNMSTFRDRRDVECWELSSWVRWYARILEEDLMVAKVLGAYGSSSSNKDKDGIPRELSNSNLLEEMGMLVSFVELICSMPDSLHLEKNSMVHEVIMMVSEDYRMVQNEISRRAIVLGERVLSLSYDELNLAMNSLKRVEVCRGRLLLVFANRKRNDEFWDLISRTCMNVMMCKRNMEEKMIVVRIRKN